MKDNSDLKYSKTISDKCEKNGETEKNDLVLHFVRPLPVSKPPSGLLHLFCLRLTVCLCVGGAIAGFCILVIGGVGKDYYTGLKSFMYIGVLSFLVSVVLLVILCATWGTGGSYIQPQDLVITVPCTCQCASEFPPGHLVIPCSEIGKCKGSKGLQDHTSIVTSTIPSEANRYCSIKNCVCRSHCTSERLVSPASESQRGNRQLPNLCSLPEEDFKSFARVSEQPRSFQDKRKEPIFDEELVRHEKLDIYKWLSYTGEQSRPVSFVTGSDSIL